MLKSTFVIIGGGIAGVSCAEQLAFLTEDESITLITASPLIKVVTNISAVTHTIQTFDVEEKQPEDVESRYPNLRIVNAEVKRVDYEERVVHTNCGQKIQYRKLCICAGGAPKLIANNPNVIGIRDTESVKTFLERIKRARRVILVGNGGIATELVHEIEGIQLIWVIKDKSISAAFVDPGAGEFFLSSLGSSKAENVAVTKRWKYTVAGSTELGNARGGALGPDWHEGLELKGCHSLSRDVKIEYECEVKAVVNVQNQDSEWPVCVHLTNGKEIGCDFLVSATGVAPSSAPFIPGIDLASDGGIKVNDKMQTSVPDVFAAGDICTADWKCAPHWFQMRLWTQARQMGFYAGKCMMASLCSENIMQDFCFEMFTHVTKFFGYKVVLLGLFNAQGLGSNYEILLRVTKGMEYVKVVMKDGKMQGAILVGETDLEETFENLILNQMDLSVYGKDLLNPDVDIEDYFD